MARGGDVDGACAAGWAAVGFATRAASLRGVERVTRMLAQLHTHADVAVVQELVDHAGVVLTAPPILR